MPIAPDSRSPAARASIPASLRAALTALGTARARARRAARPIVRLFSRAGRTTFAMPVPWATTVWTAGDASASGGGPPEAKAVATATAPAAASAPSKAAGSERMPLIRAARCARSRSAGPPLDAVAVRLLVGAAALAEPQGERHQGVARHAADRPGRLARVHARRPADDLLHSRAPDLLEAVERRLDAARVVQAAPQHDRVLDRQRRALARGRRWCVGGVAEHQHPPAVPAREVGDRVDRAERHRLGGRRDQLSRRAGVRGERAQEAVAQVLGPDRAEVLGRRLRAPWEVREPPHLALRRRDV